MMQSCINQGLKLGHPVISVPEILSEKKDTFESVAAVYYVL